MAFGNVLIFKIEVSEAIITQVIWNCLIYLPVIHKSCCILESSGEFLKIPRLKLYQIPVTLECPGWESGISVLKALGDSMCSKHTFVHFC